jgi:hypothetical protein
MNIYEASKLVVTDHQYKIVRMKKNSTPDQLDVKDDCGNKRGWTYLDAVTANLIVKVTEALNETNRNKFLSLPPSKAVEIAWKLVS